MSPLSFSIKLGYQDMLVDSLKTEYQALSSKKWLTTKEMACYLGVTEGAVRSLVHRGFFKPRKPFGPRGKSLFKRSEVDAFIEGSDEGGSEWQ
jgi:excisionase family DNA binding protein